MNQLVLRRSVWVVLVGAVLVGSFLGISSVGADQDLQRDVGRFQLFQARYEVATQTAGTKGTSTAQAVMKIDTVTGDTWEWLMVNNEGQLRQGWVEMVDDKGDQN